MRNNSDNSEDFNEPGRANVHPPVLIPDDASADTNDLLPDGLEVAGRVVHWQHSPSFSDVAVLLEPWFDARPGAFLAVWHGRRTHGLVTVIQVGDSFEVNPNEEPELSAARERLGLGRNYGREGVSTRIFRLADCTTIEEMQIKLQGSTWQVIGDIQSPQSLCRSGDPVVILPQEIVVKTIGGLSDESQGIHLGDTHDAAKAPVNLTPLMFQLHAGLFGNPSRGKSYLGGILIEEARSWDIPTLVLDLNGEMVEAAQALGGLVISLPDPKQFGISLNLITSQELVVICPNVQLGTNYAELIEAAHHQLKGECRGNPISFKDVKDRIEQIGERTKVSKPSVLAALARFGALEHDPLIGRDFNFVEQLKKHRLVVLDCRLLSLSQTRLIAAMGARHLQQIGREMTRAASSGNKEAANWFSLYFVDEAHTVIPDDEKAVSTQVFYELARMGRHVRTGLILSSQSPQDLNTSVLKRLQTRFIFALEKDQLTRIQGVSADLDEKIIRQLPKLPRGVCAVSGSTDIVRHGFLLKVRERVTPVGGGTPPVFGKRAKTKLDIKGRTA
jgi:hypothetical protein